MVKGLDLNRSYRFSPNDQWQQSRVEIIERMEEESELFPYRLVNKRNKQDCKARERDECHLCPIKGAPIVAKKHHGRNDAASCDVSAAIEFELSLFSERRIAKTYKFASGGISSVANDKAANPS